MRALPVLLLTSAVASAQSISGTFTASFTGFDNSKPTVRLDLQLMCSLSCPASAPTLHYGVKSVDGTFVSSVKERTGYIGYFFGSTASTVQDNTSFRPGSAFTVKANSATCWCGNITGQGGYVDVTTEVTVVPPYVFEFKSTEFSPTVGKAFHQVIYASPRGAETVDVHFSGGGLDTTQTMSVTDFDSTGSGQVTVTPTQAGTMTVTATLQPYGASFSQMFTVLAGSGGTGGGSSGRGGGSSSGGATASNSGGCDATASLSIVPLAVLTLLKRRAARRRHHVTR